jgi:DNA helicase-2/ATP-dependent DNA helicase PcrA
MHHAAHDRSAAVDRAPAIDRRQADCTAAQRAAITHGPGPLLLLAGPGAGKTMTLTRRAAYLHRSGLAGPGEILTVTFSRHAAGQLRRRLHALLGDDVQQISTCTFHSLCAQIIRAHSHWLGLSPRYTIATAATLTGVTVDVLGAGARPSSGEQSEAPAEIRAELARAVLIEIALAKNRLLGLERYRRRASGPLQHAAAQAWPLLDRRLHERDSVTFEDLLLGAVHLLGLPDTRAHWRRRVRWLLVDEFQDTNPAQLAVVRLLAGPNGNLTAVGDDDQAVYGFRAADPQNITAFTRSFPDARQITLATNFRSRQEIFGAAVSCVQHNTHRTPKALIASRGAGGRLEHWELLDEEREAELIAALAHRRARGELLVLCRVRQPLRDLAGRLKAHRVRTNFTRRAPSEPYTCGAEQPLGAPTRATATVRMLTIHAAKGAEAHTVVLLGAEEGLLPDRHALAEPTGAALEEERRLFYVALTRARETLIVTTSALRHGVRTAGPSRFLAEAGLR